MFCQCFIKFRKLCLRIFYASKPLLTINLNKMIATNQKLTVYSGILYHLGACCAVVLFLLMSLTGEAQICTPSITTEVRPILYVNIGEIDNTSAALSNDEYEDFTDQVTQLNPGEPYVITLDGHTGGDYMYFYTVFIDWNQNGILDDAGEVYQIGFNQGSNGTNGKAVFGNIDVPLDATNGTTRMRIRNGYGYYVMDPCLSIGLGQTEDYTLAITGLEPCTGTPSAGTPDEDALLVCISEKFTVSVSGVSDVAVGLERAWQSSPAGENNWSDIEGAYMASVSILTGIEVDTDYRYVVACINSDETDVSEVIQVGLNLNEDECFCIPSFSYSVYPITSVYFGDIHNTSDIFSPDVNSVAYEDFTDQTTQVIPGETYGINSKGYTGGNYTSYFTVFIDWNQNGVLDDAGEVYPIGTIKNSSGTDHRITFGNISVPLDAILGSTRMRVLKTYLAYPTDPCGSYLYGQAEDYTVDVVSGEIGCPNLDLFVGDACDDGNDKTTGDIVNEHCECAGTPVPDCVNYVMNPTTLIAINTPDTVVVGTCLRFQNYSVFNSIIAGYEYEFAGAQNNEGGGLAYVTVSADSANGTVIASGWSPLTITATTDANLYVHWNAGGNCMISFKCATATAICLTCSAIEDCDGVPGGSAFEGAPCDDQDPTTYNDAYTEDCECIGIPYDCTELMANIGDACDDGDEMTENDMIDDACECIGTPIAVDYDCSDLDANIGDACDLEDGKVGLINKDCACKVVATPICQSVYYLSDHDASNSITDIYEVSLIGGVATMHYIATSDIEVHIAYRADHHTIYAVSKHGNSYRTLDPATQVWGPEVSLGGDYGEITAAVFNHDGKLLIGSQTHKTIYVANVNVFPNTVATFDSYVPLVGGDLAYGSDGMLYMATRSGNGLYKVWSAPMPDDLIGILPSKVTGMAITDSDQLLISAQGNTSLLLYDTDGINTMESFELILDGEPFTLRDGDMASGCMDIWEPWEACMAFTTLLVNHGTGINGSDIYTVKFFGGNAHLTFLTNVNYEAHIAFDAKLNILYLVNVDGSFVSAYDIGLSSFLGDLPIIGDFTKLTAAVFNPYERLLYVGDHWKNEIHTIDLHNGISTYYGDAPVSGGDLGILEDGTIYLGTKEGSALYEIVAGGSAVMVGSMVPNVTGMARYNDESDDFIVSSNSATALTQISVADGSTIETYPIMLGGVPFTLTDGDMAAGCVDIEASLPPINPFVGVESQATLASYPNPTDGLSKVVFVSAETTHILLEVYDMNGRKVETLFNQQAQQNQKYTLDFNGKNLPNGVYIYRMTTNNETIIEKFMIAH